jgi:serine/threonine protein kinase
MARPVRFEDGWQGFQVRLPAEAAADRTAYTLLEAEITAALALHRAYAGTRFGRLFPTPVGHDMNTPAPFILYAVPRGRPLSGPTERVSLGDQRVVERDLVLAVRLMEEVGLVHRGIVPGAVRWDAHGVQVWDLGSVVRAGRPRVPYGVPPFASPEQRAGVGAADPRDALWSVAQVMHQLVTGRPGSPDGPPPDLTAHRSIADTLGPLFARRAQDRPVPDALLRSLVPEVAAEVAGVLLPDPLEQFRREFDDTRRRKHATLAPSPPVHGPRLPDAGRTGDGRGFDAGSGTPSYPDAPPAGSTGYEYRPRPDRSRLRTWISGGRTSGTTGPEQGRPEGDSRR